MGINGNAFTWNYTNCPIGNSYNSIIGKTYNTHQNPARSSKTLRPEALPNPVVFSSSTLHALTPGSFLSNTPSGIDRCAYIDTARAHHLIYLRYLSEVFLVSDPNEGAKRHAHSGRKRTTVPRRAGNSGR